MKATRTYDIGVKVATGLFLAFIAAGFAVFGTRYALRSLAGAQVRDSRFGDFVLRGGHTEIAGTKARPKGNEKAALQWEISDNPPAKIKLLEAAAAIDRHLGWNIPAVSQRGPFHFTMGGGYLGNASYVTRARLASRTSWMKNFTAKLKAAGGTNIVFAVCPSRYDEGDRLYENVFDFELAAIREEAKVLAADGISTIDLADRMRKSNLRPHDAFYATDHHFNDRCAIWSAMELATFVNDEFGTGLDLGALAPDNFKAHSYRQMFLGAIGKRATLSLCQKDDFRFLGTVRPVEFEFEAIRPNGSALHTRGGPKALASDPTLRRETPYAANPYGAYAYSDNAIAKIHNHSQTNGTRLLFFSDSSDNILLPVVACAATDVESIDLRHYKDDPFGYVSTNHFDAVILFWSHP